MPLAYVYIINIHLIGGEYMPSLTLMFYQGWADTAGSDEALLFSDELTFDDTKDGSFFWNYMFNASFKVYKTSGTRTSPPIDLSFIGIVAESTISWTATTPANTSIGIDVSFDGVNWTAATNGASIPILPLGIDVTGKKLYVRERLTTTQDTVTPSLSNVNIAITPGFIISNDGDLSTLPEVWIKKVGNGDVALVQITNGNKTTQFTGLANNETVYINADAQDIMTDIAGMYRYDNFNNIYPELPLGKNIYKVNGDAKITFKYQFKLI
jgi:hypothetical protein